MMTAMSPAAGVGKPGNCAMGTAYSCACLDEEFADWCSVVHGVEGGHLVHAHRRHLQDARYLVHDADACETVLALTQVEQRHHSGLLVLRRIPLDDLSDDLLILRCELEGEVGVVVGCVSVLCHAGQWLAHFCQDTCTRAKIDQSALPEEQESSGKAES